MQLVLGTVVHAYNLSTSETGKKTVRSTLDWTPKDPVSNIKKVWGWGVMVGRVIA